MSRDEVSRKNVQTSPFIESKRVELGKYIFDPTGLCTKQYRASSSYVLGQFRRLWKKATAVERSEDSENHVVWVGHQNCSLGAAVR